MKKRCRLNSRSKKNRVFSNDLKIYALELIPSFHLFESVLTVFIANDNVTF